MGATRIFIVEDEALIAMELEDRLSRLGYSVCGTAASSDDALSLIPPACPDLLLMDVNILGPLNGIEVAARLLPQLEVPVIFLSAYSDPELVHRAGEIGASGYLVKPFDERELHASIQVALTKQAQRLRLRQAIDELEQVIRERTVELAQSARETERANLAKAHFLGRAGEEVLVPLHVVELYTELALASDGLQQGHGENLQMIGEAAARLHHHLERLLLLVKIDTGASIDAHCEPLMVGPILTRQLREVKALASERGVRMGELQVAATLAPVMADRVFLERVLHSLLENAIIYNREGGSVACGAGGGADGMIDIYVEDTGAGMDEKQCTQLFREFSRFGEDSRFVDGIGIDLALALRLLRRMGGELIVSSEPGVGSRFVVRLPAVGP